MSAASDDSKPGEFFWFYALLGSIFSAFAIASLVQKVFDVGLSPVMAEALEYYRGTAHPIMHWMLGWLRWLLPEITIPDWVKDFYALSFVGSASLARVVIVHGPPLPFKLPMIANLAFAAFFGAYYFASGIGALVFFLLFIPIDRLVRLALPPKPYMTRARHAELSAIVKRFVRTVRLMLLLATAGTLMFFVLNSQM